MRASIFENSELINRESKSKLIDYRITGIILDSNNFTKEKWNIGNLESGEHCYLMLNISTTKELV